MDSRRPDPVNPGKLHHLLGDDAAYIFPFAAFVLLVSAGNQWRSLYPVFYGARAFLVAGMLMVFWPHYTKIRWSHWKLGLIVGAIGAIQWVSMQLWLQNHFDYFKPLADVFDPADAFPAPTARFAFFAMRIAGATLIVPLMEELFWRDYLWRTILAPSNFKQAGVGQRNTWSFLIVAVAFSTVHGNWWLTSIVWALMIGWLLVRTKSLGACIMAHAVTNLLLAVYVIRTGDWSFW